MGRGLAIGTPPVTWPSSNRGDYVAAMAPDPQAPVTPFTVDIDQARLDDLARRLADTRWPEAETVDDWSQGIPLAYVQELAAYWADGYDWPARQARMNRFDHFTTELDGLDIHFIHQRSDRDDAFPLVITHGWPGSVWSSTRSSSPWSIHRMVSPRSTWSARPCPATGSRASRPGPGGGWIGSPRPGTS